MPESEGACLRYCVCVRAATNCAQAALPRALVVRACLGLAGWPHVGLDEKQRCLETILRLDPELVRAQQRDIAPPVLGQLLRMSDSPFGVR